MNRLSRVFAGTITVAAAGLLSACSTPEPAKPAAESAPPPMTAEARVAWYQDCWKQFNAKDWAAFKKCYSDGASSQQMGYGKASVTGAEAIVAGSEQFMKEFPDGQGIPQLILINGTRLASASILKGTNTGPLTGPDGKEMPATNKKFGLLFGHHIDLTETGAQVTKELGVMDSATMASHLGLSKLPARPILETGVAAPVVVMARNEEKESKNVATAKAQIEAWNQHDLHGAMDGYFVDSVLFREMPMAADLNKAQVTDEVKALWKAFPDGKLAITTMWGAGDYVVSTGTLEGTNDGDFPAMKLKKTGKKMSLPFFEIDRMENGKFAEVWLFYDSGAMAAHLGVK